MKSIFILIALLIMSPITASALDVSGTYQVLKNPQKLKGKIQIKKLPDGIYELEGELTGTGDSSGYFYAKGKPVIGQENNINVVINRDMSLVMLFKEKQAEILTVNLSWEEAEDHLPANGRDAPIYLKDLEKLRFKKQ